MADSAQINFEDPYALQRNPGSTSSSAFAVVKNTGANGVNIRSFSSSVGMVMPMYFGVNHSGVWEMIDVPSGMVNVAAGVPTVFAPGYLHIMINGLTSDLPPNFDITFTFDDGSTEAVNFVTK